MSKTIKIIDLLNKIVNGEEMPKEIKFDNEVFVYIGKWEQYVTKEEEIPLLRRICDYNYSGLNDEVEIIEEQEEIDIQDIEKITDYRTSDDDLYNDNFEDFRGTINELIEAVKQLDKNIKEK